MDEVTQNDGTLVAHNNCIVGHIISEKTYEQRSLTFLKRLKSLFPKGNIEILSGDSTSAHNVSLLKDMGPNIGYHGGLSPDDKVDLMKPRSLFVGDGLNDTLALAKADVSVRLGHRILGYGPVDIEIQRPDINLVLTTLIYAQKFRSILLQTAVAAFLYNIIALSLAVMGLFSPLGAVLAMMFSFLILLLSSLRLLRVPEVVV